HMTHHVSILAFDNCFASAVVGSVDLLYAANMIAGTLTPGSPPVFAAQIVSPDGRAVRAASGYRVDVAAALAQAAPAEAVVIPGISVIEPEALLAVVTGCPDVLAWLQAQYRRGAWLAASCSGTFLLAEAGLLHARAATTTTWYAELFRTRYPTERFDAAAAIAKSERIVTGGGAFSYVDSVLCLIETFAGRELARACARHVVLDNRRGPQASALIPHHVQSHDPLIAKAERWMRAHLNASIRVNDIAAHVAVSARTLIRRFKQSTGDSPQGYLQKLRLELGKTLLANTNYRLDQILERVGYHDGSTFRRLFKKYTNLS